jgi:hypothetical protein
MNATTIRLWGQIVTAILSMLIFLGLVVEAFRRNDSGLINTVSGFAAGFASAAVQFYLGSSAGSQAKDEKLTPTPPPANPPDGP